MKSTQTAVNSERTVDFEQMIISHEDEKVALVLSLTGIFTISFIFQLDKKVFTGRRFCMGHPLGHHMSVSLINSMSQ